MSLAETAGKIGHLDDEERECLENCFEATEVCEWCADECAGEGKEMARCLRLCRDVADIASMHARFMARNSNYDTQLAQLNAGLAEECAEECERHDAEHCQVCADVLRECAETCRNMASAS